MLYIERCRRSRFVCDATLSLCQPMVLIKCAGFLFRMWSCLARIRKNAMTSSDNLEFGTPALDSRFPKSHVNHQGEPNEADIDNLKIQL